MKPTVYIAGFFDTRERIYPHRDRLLALGYIVTSSWLDEAPGTAYTTSTEEYLRQCAVRDIEDIRGSKWFILDTIDETPRGGREVELGVALTGNWPVRITVVGPLRNVFHRLANQHFETWEELFESISRV